MNNRLMLSLVIISVFWLCSASLIGFDKSSVGKGFQRAFDGKMQNPKQLMNVQSSADDMTQSLTDIIQRSKQLLEMVQSDHVDIKAVEALLSAGVDINYRDNIGNTALMTALERGYKEIVRMLLEKGADVNQMNKYGDTALMGASQVGDEEIVRMILKKGANVNQGNQNGNRIPLLTASWIGHKEIVRIFLEEGADVNQENQDGDTALMRAAKSGHTEIVRMLLDRGADVHSRNSRDETALTLAADVYTDNLQWAKYAKNEEYKTIIEMLLMFGADVHPLKGLAQYEELLRPWDALREENIPSRFNTLPTLDDYFQKDSVTGEYGAAKFKDPETGEDRVESDEKSEEKIAQFHNELQRYLIYQLQQAYDTFINNPKSPDKFKPLIDFFCNIMYPQKGNMDVIVPAFKSKDHLIALLDLLAKYTKNGNEKNKLQELSMLEKIREEFGHLNELEILEELGMRRELSLEQEREFEVILQQAKMVKQPTTLPVVFVDRLETFLKNNPPSPEDLMIAARRFNNSYHDFFRDRTIIEMIRPDVMNRLFNYNPTDSKNGENADLLELLNDSGAAGLFTRALMQIPIASRRQFFEHVAGLQASQLHDLKTREAALVQQEPKAVPAQQGKAHADEQQLEERRIRLLRLQT